MYSLNRGSQQCSRLTLSNPVAHNRPWQAPAPQDPVRTNKIPRQVPEQAWYMHPAFSVLIGGILPFGAVFIELFFILTSMWLHQVPAGCTACASARWQALPCSGSWQMRPCTRLRRATLLSVVGARWAEVPPARALTVFLAAAQFYYLFGFLCLVAVILTITCAEITIVLCYFQLCSEDYHWWCAPCPTGCLSRALSLP